MTLENLYISTSVSCPISSYFLHPVKAVILAYILGIITNAKKRNQTGKVVGTFAYGTRKVYDFINDNPFVGK